MRKIIKSIIFIVIFCLIWQYIFSILWLPKNVVSHFYDEPDNSLDVVYIGGSNVHHHFNPLLAYNLYGFSTYLLSTGVQPIILAKYLIEETEKTQKPLLYVIDITRLQDDLTDDFSETWSRYVTDSMKFSQTRTNAINELLQYAEIDKKEYINYYFSFLKYHNSWKNIDYTNFCDIMYKGYYFYDYATDIVPQEEYKWDDKIDELPQKNEQVLLDLINYIELNNINVLFVIPKSTFWAPGYQRLNYATSIIKQHNMNIINFNTITDLNIDYSVDFYDVNHLNTYGATKYTLYFAKYLKDHYNLPNHKSDKTYSSWENEYTRFKNDFKLKTNVEFDELVLEYMDNIF